MDEITPAKNHQSVKRKPYIPQAVLIALFAGMALTGAIGGVLFAYSQDLQEISELDSYAPETITRIHAQGGELIGEFATQRRVILTYDEIPEVMRQAIISAEDGTFFSHVGFNIPRILITMGTNILKGDLTAAGASTITMQLARNITVAGQQLGLEKSWQRKLREAYYTAHIEKRYTKREILTLYMNQVYWGTANQSAYGVEAAARLYFGKSASELNLNEAATIAGITPSPARMSPLVNIELARQRRNYTLQRMASEGFITQVEADLAKKEPVVLAERTARSNTVAPYFLEEVRQHLEKEYGVERLYEEGLTVHTTLNAELQKAANQAVKTGLRAHDKRQGFRKPERNILDEAKSDDNDDRLPDTVLADFADSRWVFKMTAGDIVPALVINVDNESIQVRFGSHQTTIIPRGQRVLPSGAVVGFRGIGRTPADKLVRIGDLIEIKLETLETHDIDGNELDEPVIEARLDQEPLAEAALVAIENRTGRIIAMVGGYDFERSKFNRATQAYRQLGSLFKGVLYAAAIDRGFTSTTLIQDKLTRYEVGPDQPLYKPENYDYIYDGPVTLRHALEKSKNVPAVWMMNEIGPQTVADFAKRLGFTSEIPPFLSVALGSSEHSLMEVTSAYSVFPNRGTRMLPYQIERIVDRSGVVLEEGGPVPQDAVRPDTAYIMVSLLRGVVQRGTGRGLLRLEWPVGGKTGTMDEYTDAWFVGFDPDISVGVWVGYDRKKTLGDKEEGARVALPIWRDFLSNYIEGREAPEGFAPPANIVFASVDQATGQPAEPWSVGVIQEAFIAGTEPGSTFQR